MAWYVARSLDQLLAEINASAPNRNKASDGSIGDADHSSRDSDHNPCDDHDCVCARDFTHDPGHGFDSYEFAGWLVDRCLTGTEDRCKYVISNGRIASAEHDWLWRPYSGSNPHSHHVHVSVAHPQSLFDDPAPWGWGRAPAPPDEGDLDLSASQYESLLNEIRSVGSALNKHIEQEEGTQTKVESVGEALNRHIEQEADTQQMVRDLS